MTAMASGFEEIGFIPCKFPVSAARIWILIISFLTNRHRISGLVIFNLEA